MTKKVIECSSYNGEDENLLVKLKITSKATDYYIITEGKFSHRGKEKPLVFNMTKFKEFEDKIVYVPLRNFPKINAINTDEFWENEKYNRNEAFTTLKKIASNDDIIIVSDLDEIVNPKVIKEYDSAQFIYASTQLYLFYFYYNQISVFRNSKFDYQEDVNYWYTGPKITTFEHLEKSFAGDLTSLRRSGCNIDVPSRHTVDVFCNEQLIEKAGWHFSYVMSDANLQKKKVTVVEGSFDTIEDFEKERQAAVAPNSYNKIIDIKSDIFPYPYIFDDEIFEPLIKKSKVLFDSEYNSNDCALGRSESDDQIVYDSEYNSNDCALGRSESDDQTVYNSEFNGILLGGMIIGSIATYSLIKVCGSFYDQNVEI